MRCCFDEKAGSGDRTAAFGRASCHVIAQQQLLGPSSVLRHFHLKTPPSVLSDSSAFLSFFLSFAFLWEMRAKPFLRQSLLLLLLLRGRGRQSSNGPNAPRKNPLLSSPRKDRAHLFPLSLSFCRDEDYCSRSFCRSLFSSFFITHPLIFGWLSLCRSVSRERERES